MSMELHSFNNQTQLQPLEFRPVNEQIVTARLHGKHGSMTVVQCYAPTNDSSEDEKDQLYYSLKTVINSLLLS